MGDCQNYGLFLGPYYNTGPNTRLNLGDPKRDHNVDNPIYIYGNPPPYDPARVCFLRKNHGFMHIFDGRVLAYFISFLDFSFLDGFSSI